MRGGARPMGRRRFRPTSPARLVWWTPRRPARGYPYPVRVCTRHSMRRPGVGTIYRHRVSLAYMFLRYVPIVADNYLYPDVDDSLTHGSIHAIGHGVEIVQPSPEGLDVARLVEPQQGQSLGLGARHERRNLSRRHIQQPGQHRLDLRSVVRRTVGIAAMAWQEVAVSISGHRRACGNRFYIHKRSL